MWFLTNLFCNFLTRDFLSTFPRLPNGPTRQHFLLFFFPLDNLTVSVYHNYDILTNGKEEAMPKWLDVNPRSGVPLYVQLMEQIKHALQIGALQPGEQLPTVRQLATELTIAPNTIVKAYDELARLGLIESRQGVGTIVASNIDGTLRQQQRETVFERLRALVRDAAHLEVDEERLRAEFESALQHFYQPPQSEEGTSV
jgi:GntR family transcriptional regulator